MDEFFFTNLYMRLYAAARAVHGMQSMFEWNADYLYQHKDDGMDWINCNYETVAGTMYMLDLLLDELTARLTNDEIELIVKNK